MKIVVKIFLQEGDGQSFKHFLSSMLLLLFKEAEDRVYFAKFYQYTPSFGCALGKRKGRTLSLLTQSRFEPPEQHKALQRGKERLNQRSRQHVKLYLNVCLMRRSPQGGEGSAATTVI